MGSTIMADLDLITLYLAINQLGEIGFSTDGSAEAVADLIDSFGAEAIRNVEMMIFMALPKVVVIEATLPESNGPVTVTVS